MSDDTRNRSPQDASRISLSEDWEVSYWTKALGITRERLEQAVEAVGNSAAKVRDHLKG